MAPLSLEAALRLPSNKEELTQATKVLDGKRNPEILESQDWGSLASLLSCKDQAAFRSAASLPHTCGIFPVLRLGCCSASRLCQGGSEDSACVWPSGTCAGPSHPAAPSPVPGRAPAPAEIPGKVLPGITGLSLRAEQVLLAGIHASWEKKPALQFRNGI